MPSKEIMRDPFVVYIRVNSTRLGAVWASSRAIYEASRRDTEKVRQADVNDTKWLIQSLKLGPYSPETHCVLRGQFRRFGWVEMVWPTRPGWEIETDRQSWLKIGLVIRPFPTCHQHFLHLFIFDYGPNKAPKSFFWPLSQRQPRMLNIIARRASSQLMSDSSVYDVNICEIWVTHQKITNI